MYIVVLTVQYDTYNNVHKSHFDTGNMRFRARRLEKGDPVHFWNAPCCDSGARTTTTRARLASPTGAGRKPRQIACKCVLRKINNFHQLSVTSTKVQQLSGKQVAKCQKWQGGKWQGGKVKKRERQRPRRTIVRARRFCLCHFATLKP
jgi:hypothetical protein